MGNRHGKYWSTAAHGVGRECAHRVGIHETGKKKVSMFKGVKCYLARFVLGEDVDESRLGDVLFDPDNVTGCTDGEQTPGQTVET